MKLLDILKEISIADLSPEQKKELFKQGSLLVPLPTDPDRPGTTSSQVLNLPKIDQIKKDIIMNKREFDVYMFSSNPDIKNTAKEINKLYNQLFRAMNALDKLTQLQNQGRS
jgi:hypothetical protein